jgi:hypothetical protein
MKDDRSTSAVEPFTFGIQDPKNSQFLKISFA